MGGAHVSNTGPLVALAVIDRLDLLHCLFDEVIVPEAVRLAKGIGCRAPYPVLLRRALPAPQ